MYYPPGTTSLPVTIFPPSYFANPCDDSRQSLRKVMQFFISGTIPNFDETIYACDIDLSAIDQAGYLAGKYLSIDVNVTSKNNYFLLDPNTMAEQLLLTDAWIMFDQTNAILPVGTGAYGGSEGYGNTIPRPIIGDYLSPSPKLSFQFNYKGGGSGSRVFWASFIVANFHRRSVR